ncbi:MAG: hypothetical protein J5903_00860 [Clostridia bacterium]|nr:hypothetical protein [Clostridia bacterium]
MGYKSIKGIKFNSEALAVTDALERAGYEAYIVGGAVRDALRGVASEDTDVATSALPEQVKEVFNDCAVIETGIMHGTVTVLYGGLKFEITTFRSDGAYTDHRRPDGVTFVGSIEDDLARRDFTVNAIAYNQERGFIDLYGGISDLDNKILRAVGDPKKRFEEDALRILRAVRFASTLGFEVENGTANAAKELCGELSAISVERTFAEMTKSLSGKYVAETFLKMPEVVFAVIPELAACYKFVQHSRWHKYDVYEHIVRSVGSVKGGDALKWTMLLHDIENPRVFSPATERGIFTVTEKSRRSRRKGS